MSSSGNGNAFVLVGCVPILALVVFNIFIGGLCTEYVVEYWASFATGKPVDIPFWVAALVGLFLGEFFVPAAAVTWLLSFALVCSACV
jgi:hypothetical protein